MTSNRLIPLALTSLKRPYAILKAILLTTTLTSSLSVWAAAEKPADRTLLIRDVQIVSGTSGKASKPKDVLIQGNTIVKIARGIKAPQKDSKTIIIDAKGKFLTPGLIDSHVHLRGIPGYKDDGSMDAALVEQTLKQIPRNYLYFGFTTLLDLANDGDFIRNWNKAEIAPNAMRCAPVMIPHGYPLAWLDEHEQFHAHNTRYMLFDPARAAVYPEDFKPEEHSPKNIVDNANSDGAACIKVFYETGFGPKKGLPVPTLDLVKSLVGHAHARNMKVYMHGNSQASYEFGLASGVDTLAHGMWHWASLQEADLTERTQFAKNFAESGISVHPTIQVINGELELFEPNFFKSPRVSKVMSKDLIAWYQSEAGQWFKGVMKQQFPGVNNEDLPFVVAKAYKTPIEQVMQITKLFADHGTTLLFGSDTPSGPIYTQFPGINGRTEMDLWLEAGLSLQQLFEGMTVNNAIQLGLENQIGKVEEGFDADLLLLSENPLKSVNAYDEIEWVILKGNALARASLAAN